MFIFLIFTSHIILESTEIFFEANLQSGQDLLKNLYRLFLTYNLIIISLIYIYI